MSAIIVFYTGRAFYMVRSKGVFSPRVGEGEIDTPETRQPMTYPPRGLIPSGLQEYNNKNKLGGGIDRLHIHKYAG